MQAGGSSGQRITSERMSCWTCLCVRMLAYLQLASACMLYESSIVRARTYTQTEVKVKCSHTTNIRYAYALLLYFTVRTYVCQFHMPISSSAYVRTYIYHRCAWSPPSIVTSNERTPACHALHYVSYALLYYCSREATNVVPMNTCPL